MARIRKIAEDAAKATFEHATKAIRFARRTRAVHHEPLVKDDDSQVRLKF